MKEKALHITLMIASCISCTDDKEQKKVTIEHKIIVPEFQSVIDSAHVDGVIMIHDLVEDQYYSNDFDDAHSGHLPASTFKIANSIIALETGIIQNDNTLITWDGTKRGLKQWEQDLTFTEAFHYSCVPCYQEIARKIGMNRMRRYLDTLNYGNMAIDSSSIDLFWLEGESRISPSQQIDFLKRLYQSKLPISKRTDAIMKRLLLIEENEDYALSGKTGWSIRNGHNNGWFVGYIESQNKTYFFATNVSPRQQFDMDIFPMIRIEVTLKALSLLNIIN